MSLQVFHQLGFRHNWNLQMWTEKGVGDGVIIPPRFLAQSIVEGFSSEIKGSSIFDPQFFNPNFPKGELSTYDFFPDVIADGFETSDYDEKFAGEGARLCVEFQLRNKFKYIVIPTRYFPGMRTDFISYQQKTFIDPFLRVLKENGNPDNIILQLVINNNMIGDQQYVADLLNWITGVRELRGVYLITEVTPRNKQLKDVDFLLNLLRFVYNLRENALDVVLGYLNTEALLLSVAQPTVVTMGSYENLRMFNIRNFENLAKKIQQGPNPRLYVSQLLQSIDRNYIGAMSRVMPTVFDNNEYQALMFTPSYKWHFSKPELYKHHMLEFYRQLKSIADLQGQERYRVVFALIARARNLFADLEQQGVYFDQENDGSHLAAWQTAAAQFAAEVGWR